MAIRGLERGQRAALIVNECQNAIVSAEFSTNAGLVSEVSSRGVLATIARLAAAFRAASLPVVHSTIVLRADGVGMLDACLLLGVLRRKGGVVIGTPGAQIHLALKPNGTDYLSQRLHGLTPFHGTELEMVLRSQGVQTVVVAGVSTNVGVPVPASSWSIGASLPWCRPRRVLATFECASSSGVATAAPDKAR